MEPNTDAVEQVAIVGSGPAGWTAAIYAARANLKPLLFEGDQPGGQLTITTDVENYPGFPTGVMGPELMEHFRNQAVRFETRVVASRIDSIDLSQRPFVLKSGDKVWRARSVIVSSGATAKWLGVKGEREYGGHGVSACATCDGFFFKKRHVLVVGGGDTAMEEASFLSKHASKVTIVHRRDTLRASKIMGDRARANPKIEFLWNAAIEEIVGDGKVVTGVKLLDTVTGKRSDLECAGVFMGIGHEPNTKFLNGQLDLDEAGYVKTVPGSTRTNIEGVFACGDVQDPTYRQAVTAAGTGCMAAIDAERWLAHGH